MKPTFRRDAPPDPIRGAAEVTVNRHSVVLLLSLISPALSAEELPDPVFVRAASVVLVRPSRLPEVCHTRVPVRACTAFVGQVLTGSCEPEGGAWRIRARAQFIPIVYATNGDHFAHERDHVRDIEKAVRAYIGELATRSFDSEPACRSAATLESEAFPRLMDVFKDDSNAERHPQYQRVFARDHSRKPVIR